MTLAEIAFASGFRQHWPRVLLAVSLVLNLFFIAGAVWVRLHPPGLPRFEQRIDRMADELGLNEPQKQAFERYVETMRERSRAMHEAIQPAIAAAWAEMAGARADETKVMRLLDEASQQRHDFLRDMTTTTLSFLSGLSAEERAKFVQLAREHRLWGPPPRHPQAR